MPIYQSNITQDNINNLEVSWAYKTNSYITAQPLCLNDKLYVSDWAGYIYCIDCKTGKLIYSKRLYIPPQPNRLLRNVPLINIVLGEPLPYFWYGFAGTGCIDDGIWYLASVGGQSGSVFHNGRAGKLYAVNIEDGSLLWSKPLSLQPYSGSLAVPTFDESRIYAATCSIDETASAVYKLLQKPFSAKCVGEIFAFDKFSGKKIWSRKTIELDPTDLKNSSGVGVWGGLQLDNTGENLLFATGNTYEKPVSKASDSVISIKKKDGTLNWMYQAVANDAWLPVKKEGPDFDFGCTPITFPCNKAISRFAVGAGNKNGYFYALDQKTGNLLWKTFCHINSKPDDGIRSNATFKDGKLFVWSKNEKPKNTMSVFCMNAETGELIWCENIKGTNSMTTGAITNDLYILGNYSGDLFALNTSSGKKVWSLNLGKCSIGSNISIYKNAVYFGVGLPQLYGGFSRCSGVYKVSFPK